MDDTRRKSSPRRRRAGPLAGGVLAIALFASPTAMGAAAADPPSLVVAPTAGADGAAATLDSATGPLAPVLEPLAPVLGGIVPDPGPGSPPPPPPPPPDPDPQPATQPTQPTQSPGTAPPAHQAPAASSPAAVAPSPPPLAAHGSPPPPPPPHAPAPATGAARAVAVPGHATVRPPAPVAVSTSLRGAAVTPVDLAPALLAGPRSTAALIELLRGLDVSPATLARVLAPFPVAGPARYGDDFGAPRRGPGEVLRTREGTDIFAARGTPVIASAAGTVANLITDDAVTGTGLSLRAPGGDAYSYAHLDRFAPGLVNGAPVTKGQVIGFVGSTGNAASTEPHLHFEIHPSGGAAVNPVPYLDRWLADATTAAALLSATPTGAFSADGRSASGVKARNGAAPNQSTSTRARPHAGTVAGTDRGLTLIAAVGDRLALDWSAAAAVFALIGAVAWRIRRPHPRGARGRRSLH